MAANQEHELLHPMRHSLAHIMATAITRLWPDVKLGVGPVVENGFYYDVDLGDTQLREEHFEKIEAEMHKIITEDQTFERFTKPVDEAIAWAQSAKQPYKEELLNDLKRAGTTIAKELDADEIGVAASGDSKVEEVSFYKNGDFTDLCRGPHVESTGKVGVFKLLRVSGAYWRGKEGNPQMQRVYGIAFATDKDLRSYLNMLEEAKKRDHRKLGQELDLFVFSDLVGAGLPMYTPHGTVLRNGLTQFSEEVREKLGFEKVWTPHITKKDLYEKSGHWAKFGPELFLVKSQETSDELVMKPMNCPHHNQIYASRPRSYRELPMKFMESATAYRDEKTGELHGLSRVRSLTQDDSHAYCTPEQVEGIVGALIVAINDFYRVIDMKLEVRLSFRDESEGYLGSQDLWDFAQNKIEEMAVVNHLKFYKEEGEAAFYGPKIDFMAIDAIGRKWQVATVQFDFVQPERFGLTYTDETGAQKQPIMVHCAIMGSFDRFFSVYIEHTGGRFPIWLAPEQLRVITVNQEPATVEFAESIAARGRELGVRVTVDNNNETVGKKIRSAESMKVPYSVVIGQKEIEGGELVPRIRKDMEVSEKHDPRTVEELLVTIVHETKARVNKTSL
jgi:threonyl-tRNA synthetase